MYKIKDKFQEIDKKLASNPNGFDLDDYYSCVICSKTVGSGQGWYDKFGPKCMLCQKAVNEGVIPEIVCLKRSNWLALWEVRQLGFHSMVIKKLIRRRKLKAKIIKNDKGEPYFYVFIKKENLFIERLR